MICRVHIFTPISIGVLTTFILFFSSAVNSEVVNFHPCSYNSTQQCTINQVSVDPCPEAVEGEPCSLSYGTKSSLSFNYTPNFSSNRLWARAYSVTFLADLPFLGMDTEACNYTKCPSEANQTSTYTYFVDILNEYPRGPYTAKWRLWNEEDKECCFLVQIKIE